MKTKIDDCKKYWNEIVEKDYEDFVSDQGDVRAAFHCAISLFHMTDWLYKEKGLPYWQSHGLKFTDRTGASVNVHDDKSFANAIATTDPNFELIRGIANSAKHFDLKQRGNHPSAPIASANTYSRQAGFDASAFDATSFDATDEVMLEGPGGNDLPFMDIAKSVRDTLEKLCATHGVALK
jgi:hypothetical protein